MDRLVQRVSHIGVRSQVNRGSRAVIKAAPGYQLLLLRRPHRDNDFVQFEVGVVEGDVEIVMDEILRDHHPRQLLRNVGPQRAAPL